MDSRTPPLPDDTAPPPPRSSDDVLFQQLAQELADGGGAHWPQLGERRRVLPVVGAKPPLTLSHTHDAVMNWMLANPERNLRDCADHFGYTQAWLSTLIHSGLFQARLKEKQETLFSAIAGDLTTKLTATADVGVEKLSRMIEESESPKFVLEATKAALASLGFGSKTAGPANNVHAQNVQQNFYVASPADLVAARERMIGGGATSPSPAPEPAEATPTLSPPQAEGPDVLTATQGESND